jgi:ABC-type sulfate transport system permease component
MFFSSFLIFVVLFTAIVLTSTILYLGWHDFSYFMSKGRTWSCFLITVWTSLAATFFSMMVGIPVGYTLSRHKPFCSDLLNTVISLPIMVSPCAIGVFLLAFCKSFPMSGLTQISGVKFDHAVAGVVLAQFTVTCTFCILLVKASFDTVNPRFESVSRSLGASVWRTFFTVSLPLAKNGLLASLIIVWARAAAEWESLMIFVGGIQGKTDVLPFAVYLDWNSGKLGWALTSSVFCIIIAIGSMYSVQKIGGKGYVW